MDVDRSSHSFFMSILDCWRNAEMWWYYANWIMLKYFLFYCILNWSIIFPWCILTRIPLLCIVLLQLKQILHRKIHGLVQVQNILRPCTSSCVLVPCIPATGCWCSFSLLHAELGSNKPMNFFLCIYFLIDQSCFSPLCIIVVVPVLSLVLLLKHVYLWIFSYI